MHGIYIKDRSHSYASVDIPDYISNLGSQLNSLLILGFYSTYDSYIHIFKDGNVSKPPMV